MPSARPVAPVVPRPSGEDAPPTGADPCRGTQIDPGVLDYVRRARRLRHRLADQPGRLQRSLRDLAYERDAAKSPPAQRTPANFGPKYAVTFGGRTERHPPATRRVKGASPPSSHPSRSSRPTRAGSRWRSSSGWKRGCSPSRGASICCGKPRGWASIASKRTSSSPRCNTRRRARRGSPWVPRPDDCPVVRAEPLDVARYRRRRTTRPFARGVVDAEHLKGSAPHSSDAVSTRFVRDEVCSVPGEGVKTEHPLRYMSRSLKGS